MPEAECGICQPQLAAFLEPGDDMGVRFVSTVSADKAGIQTQLPRMSESVPVIEAFCETQYNLNTLAKITPLVGGVIRRVFKDVGQTATTGEPLVELHSAEVATAKSDYLSAVVEMDIRRQSFDGEKRLREQNITSEKELLEAQSAYRKSGLVVGNLRQRLINLGLESDEIVRVEKDQDTSAQLIIRAPFDGTLIERKSVIGEAVEAGHALFTLADLSTRWLEISIPSDYTGQLQVGQPVEAVFPEFPQAKIVGNIIWVDTSIDADTRMIRARALVSQNAEKLAAGMFGKIYIAIGNERLSAIVPREAVQRHNGADFVFVQDAPDLFALRRVALGSALDGNVQVIAGLDSRDPVVTDGSFIVMSEFLKSRLGAGCVDD
jgi:membrane fusion protein, heavy metal efflux system